MSQAPGRRLYPHPSLPSDWAAEPPLADWLQDPAPPVIWSLAGHDSGGGAGLSADTRAAAAFGVHLCPVLAAVTAQNSQCVAAVFPLPAEQVRAQLKALAQDLSPRVIKTGLLASVAAVQALCEVIDALRRDQTVLLVIDPVLGATAGGAAFCDEALLQAYREQLLPRCDLLTPNRREAERLLGLGPGSSDDPPALAQALRALGPRAVCVTGGDESGAPTQRGLALDWIDVQAQDHQAQGWLALPRLPSRHHHGTGCSFATSAAAALARGFPLADALVLAKMATWSALRDGHAAGAGAGPVRAAPGFIADPSAMPVLSFGAEPLNASTVQRWRQVLSAPTAVSPAALGLYAITDDPQRLPALARAGYPQLQLRIKSHPGLSEAALRQAITSAVEIAASHPNARLWINDHWQLALPAGARALHLGQEDWAALAADQRQQIMGSGALLGLSSHSLWELARARSLAPHYIACGPVWATVTKDMPWRPQGLDNLAWWVRMAGRPVVAIGGITDSERVTATRRTGAASACLVRALDQGEAEQWHTAWEAT
ncbi:bifunctional hydroxymethylpyrimidine kinase/phosphomethylpyrimidine kinase [Paucibacter sp. DJ1R-11]|uniref:bifunctional hydroxymethylpyrimidine kinase/phosphomethylpyrimidine kinase n=1 Tax=Paucibacter sp. DJ1R-11 TaxID=2893556 RepID=UPI0021E451B8|nr:bifunctional hydroxymethylpyrimidine kinase/phosphomethylpyrimidine kinase [Paucibacter sp. DJ1R-11]MCV2365370.1 bifunctional hydroxymethylpyrimidine kinase/phosphomethylpyrimidine kinase [Paucibacter sp. DJ1R-11]